MFQDPRDMTYKKKMYFKGPYMIRSINRRTGNYNLMNLDGGFNSYLNGIPIKFLKKIHPFTEVIRREDKRCLVRIGQIECWVDTEIVPDEDIRVFDVKKKIN